MCTLYFGLKYRLFCANGCPCRKSLKAIEYTYFLPYYLCMDFLLFNSIYREICVLDADILEKYFGRLQTDVVILTNERIEHVKRNHPEDYEKYVKSIVSVIVDPDEILKDSANEGTALYIKRLSELNLNVVVRLALNTDETNKKNSVITFYRIRDKNLKKLEENNQTIYKKV